MLNRINMINIKCFLLTYFINKNISYLILKKFTLLIIYFFIIPMDAFLVFLNLFEVHQYR